jgi:alkaline phosphatase
MTNLFRTYFIPSRFSKYETSIPQKYLTTFLLLAGLCLPGFEAQAEMPSDAKAKFWYKSGQDFVKQQKRSTRGDKKAKNVILFVGDGMSGTTVTASRIYEGQMKGRSGEENALSFETFPNVALSKTYAVDRQVPDSASTATAMLTGVKVRFRTVGVDGTAVAGNCDAGRLRTLLESAEQKGLSTGFVTTTRITHATPAATYAHVTERDNEAQGAGCADIAQQLIEFPYGDGLEVALGGGRQMFLPEAQGGKRKDGRDLTAEWQSKFENAGYVTDSASLKAVAKSTDHLLGLFSNSHMNYSALRDASSSDEPSLTEMTEKAIELLKSNRKGFFLLVEAGRIDHGHHAGIAKLALADTVELSNAVRRATELVGPETLIIVTADHSHTMTMAGYPKRGNPILGFAGKDVNELPYTTLSYANGTGYKKVTDTRVDLSEVDTNAVDYKQEATVPLGIETHGGEDVAIYSTGPGSQWINGVMEQNAIFHVMNEALFGDK